MQCVIKTYLDYKHAKRPVANERQRGGLRRPCAVVLFGHVDSARSVLLRGVPMSTSFYRLRPCSQEGHVLYTKRSLAKASMVGRACIVDGLLAYAHAFTHVILRTTLLHAALGLRSSNMHAAGCHRRRMTLL